MVTQFLHVLLPRLSISTACRPIFWGNSDCCGCAIHDSAAILNPITDITLRDMFWQYGGPDRAGNTTACRCFNWRLLTVDFFIMDSQNHTKSICAIIIANLWLTAVDILSFVVYWWYVVSMMVMNFNFVHRLEVKFISCVRFPHVVLHGYCYLIM